MNAREESRVLTLNQLAATYLEAGQWEDALEPARRALQLVGEQPSVRRVITLDTLAQVHRFLGDNATGLPYSQQAVAVCEAMQDGERPELRKLLSGVMANLGALYRLTKRFEEAEATLGKALVICSSLPGSEDAIGKIHHSLGLLRMDMGDYETAGPHLSKAVEATRSLIGTMNLRYAVQLSALADWNRFQGNLSTAVRLHEEVTAMYEKIYGLDHPNFGSNLCSLAKLYSAMKWNDKAEDALRRAEQIFKVKLGERHPIYRECINNLYVTLAESGRYQEAEKQIWRSLKLVSETDGTASPLYATGLHNLINLLPHMSESSLTGVAAEFLATDDEPRATIQASMDQFFALLKAGQLRLALLRKVAEIERANGQAHSATYATTLLSLGMAHLDEGDLTAAEASLRESLDIQRRCATHPRPELATHLNALADTCVVAGRPLEALELLKEANSVDTFVLSQVFVTGSEEERAKHTLALRQNYHVFLSLILEFIRDSGDARDSAFNLALQRKGLGGEALAAQREAMISGKYGGAANNAEWRRLRTEIARRTLAGEQNASMAGSLIELIARKEAMERDFARTIPEMGLANQLRMADRAAVQAALPQDAVMVEYVQFAKYDFLTRRSTTVHYTAFVLSKSDTAAHMIDLGEREAVDQLVARFRSAATGGELGRHLGFATIHSTVDDLSQSGSDLRRLVFDPLLPLLGNASKILIAADGDLTRLPFEVLPMDSGGYLIDHLEFSYLNSGRDLLRHAAPHTQAASPSVVFADPDFDFACEGTGVSEEFAPGSALAREMGTRGIRFTRLPGTRIEGERVAELLEVAPVLDRNALKGRLKKVASPFVLHIATHGFFLTGPHEAGEHMASYFNMAIQNPLSRAGLALAGANRTLANEGGLPSEGENGILTAEDVALMDLSGTELVVLSACDTGLGDITVGEGVYGLQRAVVTAGARTLVMSLWKVPDQQTQELMLEFYRRALSGQPLSAALRDAQLELRQRHPHPFLWGAFICHGDPGPLRKAIPVSKPAA